MTAEQYESVFAQLTCPHGEHEYCEPCNVKFFEQIIKDVKEHCVTIAIGVCGSCPEDADAEDCVVANAIRGSLT